MRQSFPLLVPRSYPQHPVCAGCCPPLLGAGPSRRSLCVSCPACLVPYPGSPWSASTRFFLHDIGLPSCGPGRRSAKPVQRLQSGVLFEAAVMSSWSGPPGGSPPRSLLPIRLPPYGSRDFSLRASRGLLPSYAPDMLAVRIEQWTAEDFHLIRSAALSAAPRTTY